MINVPQLDVLYIDCEDNKSTSSNESIASKHIPEDFIFPSFFVFVLWGPFVPADKRLPLTLVSDKGVKQGRSRSTQRAKDKNSKMIDLINDNENVRGFTTDQRIIVETLNAQKQNVIDH